MPLNAVNAVNFIQQMKQAKQLWDAAQQLKTAYETYQKYQWAIQAAKKVYKYSNRIIPAEDRVLHMRPWFTVDVWDHTFGRKQAKEREIKKKYKEKFLPPKGKPWNFGGESQNLGRKHRSDSGW